MADHSNSIWTRRKRRSRRFQFEICVALAVLAAAFAIKSAISQKQPPPRDQAVVDAVRH